MKNPREGEGSLEGSQDALEERSLRRRERLVANRASSYEEAEAWDLDFWQQRTPQERLSALVALRRELEKVEAARRSSRPRS
jgi:hypothetical protein